MDWRFVSLGTWQARAGEYRYQIRDTIGELGPWMLDVYNDSKSSPGNVSMTRYANIATRAEAEQAAQRHATYNSTDWLVALAEEFEDNAAFYITNSGEYYEGFSAAWKRAAERLREELEMK